ncbi:SDR family NAD(P)-dependent oxidoreductase [Caldalkalibacillus mannanilyticus]|uniref:SDR family NAD(P)-dependent oxidoreductase n=1 Tax=Caldalkalibacillus mannanilyticus TaxID=1418 RepID=UPI000469B042|nr:glucose 1-dehydrogenase [Caldalkalibacillus mannanilyticus]
MIHLDGKNALVTGGGTGIGRGIALGLAEAGANVVVHYGSNAQGAEEVVKEIQNMGRKALSVQADVMKKEQIMALVQETKQFFNGRLDILVNNAGHLVQRSSVEEMSEELWHHIMDVNVTSTFLVSQAAIPLMKETGGRIVNMTSLAAHNGGGPGAAAYAASKGAVLTFTKGLAKELAPYNITVNAVSPGLIGDTPFHDTFSTKEGRLSTVKGIPLGREGKPRDVCGAVLYFVSALGEYVTGETTEINGGLFMK